jgi:hypothetical protein
MNELIRRTSSPTPARDRRRRRCSRGPPACCSHQRPARDASGRALRSDNAHTLRSYARRRCGRRPRRRFRGPPAVLLRAPRMTHRRSRWSLRRRESSRTMTIRPAPAKGVRQGTSATPRPSAGISASTFTMRRTESSQKVARSGVECTAPIPTSGVAASSEVAPEVPTTSDGALPAGAQARRGRGRLQARRRHPRGTATNEHVDAEARVADGGGPPRLVLGPTFVSGLQSWK